jgi:hypothetical protein
MGDLVSASTTDTVTTTQQNNRKHTEAARTAYTNLGLLTQFFLPDYSIANYSSSREQRQAFVLVVEGIKMGASIALNGVLIGNVTNQFRRYTLQLPEKGATKGALCDSGIII